MKLPTNYTKLTPFQRRIVREHYVTKQNNKCMFCNNYLDEDPPIEITSKWIDWSLFPGGKNFLNHPIHLQHNHNTGMTEGAVHAFCNAYMWQYEGR